jgi:BirA family biotin operon repressor/biotin-[acetyl-CoA-carboxylase] ligase
VSPTSSGFPLSRAAARDLEILDAVDSTNAELVRRERVREQPHLAAIATLDQRGGRGRLGRTWSAEPGDALAVSVLLRPRGIPGDRLGLLPLIGGLAAQRAVGALLPGRRVAIKWPNDVLLGDRKLVGVLAELVSETGAVVLGTGINTAMPASRLPVPTATSIAIESGESGESAEDLADRVLAGYLVALAELVGRLEDAAGDLGRSGIRAELEAACGTIGARVRVELPDGTSTTGTATGIADDGALLLRADGSGAPAAILAGDVTHLRYQ